MDAQIKDGGTPTSGTPAPGASRWAGLLDGHPWAVVAVLMLVTTLNYLDRTLPMILAEPLKLELGLSDTTLGLLNGIGFTLVYAIAGIPIARIADRGRYGLVITTAVGFWSLMTALGSLAMSGATLALTRAGVAIGEAGCTPTAHAFISAKFAPQARASAFAVLTTATAMGSLLGLAGGGLLAQAFGWRGTMLFMGALGIVLAPIILLLLGPGTSLPAHKGTASADFHAMLKKPSMKAILAAFCFMSMATYAMGAFAPTFLMRVHGFSVGKAGVQLGLMNGATGIVALLATGWIAGRLTRRDSRWGLGVLLILLLPSIPISAAAFIVMDGTAAMLLIGLSYAVMASYLALTVAPVHMLVPVSMRAQSSAMLLFCSGVIGGCGPLITGMISDRLTPAYGPQALGYGLMIVPICLALGAIFYIWAIASLRRDMVEDAA